MTGRSNAVSGGPKFITISEQNSQDFYFLKINGNDIPQGGSIDVEVGSYVKIEASIGNWSILTSEGYDVPRERIPNPPPSLSAKAPPMEALYYIIAPNVDVVITR